MSDRQVYILGSFPQVAIVIQLTLTTILAHGPCLHVHWQWFSPLAFRLPLKIIILELIKSLLRLWHFLFLRRIRELFSFCPTSLDFVPFVCRCFLLDQLLSVVTWLSSIHSSTYLWTKRRSFKTALFFRYWKYHVGPNDSALVPQYIVQLGYKRVAKLQLSPLFLWHDTDA